MKSDQPAFPGFSHTHGRGPLRRNDAGEWEEFVPGMDIKTYAAIHIAAGCMADPEFSGSSENIIHLTNALLRSLDPEFIATRRARIMDLFHELWDRSLNAGASDNPTTAKPHNQDGWIELQKLLFTEGIQT